MKLSQTLTIPLLYINHTRHTHVQAWVCSRSPCPHTLTRWCWMAALSWPWRRLELVQAGGCRRCWSLRWRTGNAVSPLLTAHSSSSRSTRQIILTLGSHAYIHTRTHLRSAVSLTLPSRLLKQTFTARERKCRLQLFFLKTHFISRVPIKLPVVRCPL